MRLTRAAAFRSLAGCLLALSLTGPALAQPRAATVLDLAGQQKNLTTFVAAVHAAGLDDTLKAAGPITVYAPTDEAFAKLPAADRDALMHDPARLKALLLGHVVNDMIKMRDGDSTITSGSVASAGGGTLNVRHSTTTARRSAAPTSSATTCAPTTAASPPSTRSCLRSPPRRAWRGRMVRHAQRAGPLDRRESAPRRLRKRRGARFRARLEELPPRPALPRRDQGARRRPRRDHDAAQRAARGVRRGGRRARRHRAGGDPALERRPDHEGPVPPARRQRSRSGADGTPRRAQHGVHLVASGLRLRVHVLLDRPGRVLAQSHARPRSSTRRAISPSSSRATGARSPTWFSWAKANRSPTWIR